ncbi:hypothetical protein BsWGS_29118 [Bradybaena similaris]
MAAAANPQPDSVSHVSEALSGHATDEFEADDENRMETSQHSYSIREKEKKIGHRRVDKSGIVSYKKKPTSELMAAIQLGIGQSVGGLSAKPERDVLMQDFGVVEVVFFPSEGSNLTPAHHYSDFRFKTYAPVAFRYFRDLFGIQPDDFMLSLCDEPLKELSNPGASGSIFYLTQDDEFIIKTVQHKEADFLQKLLPGYFLNISQNKRTLLPKFYGLFCYQCGGKNIRFTVMNNLLPSTVKLHEKYDMKGSTYKRKASKHERSKSSPTLKDLDFMDNHPEGLVLEKETYDALIKTLQRDCRVLESFKIMDYSLLVGIYNLDLVKKEKMSQNTSSEMSGGYDTGGPHAVDGHAPTGHTSLQRGKSFKTRIGQYSTPMESIQGNAELPEDLLEDADVPSDIDNHIPHWLSSTHVSFCPGGIPARNAKGERLLLYLGIIDILQSFRLKKRLEHTVKSMVIDGDTISVHRPSYYAQRFLQYHAQRVFKKATTGLKHSPSKKKSIASKVRNQPPIAEQPEGGNTTAHKTERTGRTISFSDETPVVVKELINLASGSGAVGGRPDLLPEYSTVPAGSSHSSPSTQSPAHSMDGGARPQKRSEAFNMTTYPSEDALSAGTASTVSLRGVGVNSASGAFRGPSPPLSLSESTPTHTDFTEGTPSFTNSSPSCCSDVMDMGSTSLLETSEKDSPARSPARSPDPRHHGGKLPRGGAVSPLVKSMPPGSIEEEEVIIESSPSEGSDTVTQVSVLQSRVQVQVTSTFSSLPATSSASASSQSDSEQTAKSSSSPSTPSTVTEITATESKTTGHTSPAQHIQNKTVNRRSESSCSTQ